MRLAAARFVGGAAIGTAVGYCTSAAMTPSTPQSPSAAAAVEYIEPSTLVAWIRNQHPGFAIVDARTTDYGAKRYGGLKIAGAYHFPVSNMRADPSRLVDGLRKARPDVDTVVFHCMYSQYRGPESARHYLAAGGLQRILVLRGGFANFHKTYGDADDAGALFEPAKPPRLVESPGGSEAAGHTTQ